MWARREELLGLSVLDLSVLLGRSTKCVVQLCCKDGCGSRLVLHSAIMGT